MDKDKKLNETETEELGAWTKELLKPENLIGPFDTTEELFEAMRKDD